MTILSLALVFCVCGCRGPALPRERGHHGLDTGPEGRLGLGREGKAESGLQQCWAEAVTIESEGNRII